MANHTDRAATSKATAAPAKAATNGGATNGAEGAAVAATAAAALTTVTGLVKATASGGEIFVPRSKGELRTDVGLDEIDERVDAVDGDVISGGFAGPMWVPHYSEFRDEIIAEKLGKLNPGSSARKTIAGQLVQDMAWGRPLYFLDVPLRSGGAVRVHIPEHESLYGSLGNVRLGGVVKLTFAGRGKAKPEQAAPVLYEVRLPNAAKDLLSARRADALKPVKTKDREQQAAATDEG